MSSATHADFNGGWKIRGMKLESIGPFDHANVEFQTEGVTLITGQSGTGKTLLLDAIRWMFGIPFVSDAKHMRRIQREAADCITLDIRASAAVPSWVSKGTAFRHEVDLHVLAAADASPTSSARGSLPGALDYWAPALTAGEYRIAALTQQQEITARAIYKGCFDGVRHAPKLAEIFWRFDYLADSKDPAERALGVAMLDAARRIAAASLIDGGEFSHVKRTTYETMFVQAGQLVPWSKLSSANQHLLGGMLSLLDRMYRLSLLVGTPPSQITETPGILLIDEVETHLHPAWQKRVLPTIKEIFPRIQIIATTHSPFVLASMPGARVYACRQREDRKACVVEHIDEDFSSKPIDEILMSRAFEMTQPYSEVISRLLRERHAAFEANDTAKRRTIEQRLEALNPEEFSIFSLDERIAAQRESSQGAQGGE